MKPHIYLLRGEWTCARKSGQWHIWPYGKGSTPNLAYLHWQCLMSIEKIRVAPSFSDFYTERTD
jgi:hypothetical protein